MRKPEILAKIGERVTYKPNSRSTYGGDKPYGAKILKYGRLFQIQETDGTSPDHYTDDMVKYAPSWRIWKTIENTVLIETDPDQWEKRLRLVQPADLFPGDPDEAMRTYVEQQAADDLARQQQADKEDQAIARAGLLARQLGLTEGTYGHGRQPGQLVIYPAGVEALLLQHQPDQEVNL